MSESNNDIWDYFMLRFAGRISDKEDLKLPKFDAYDMVDFAEQWADKSDKH